MSFSSTMSLKNIIQVSKKFFTQHPLGRGMVSYSITFPTACFIQEFYDKKNLHDVNWKKCVRYSLYGAFMASPMFYCWMRVANRIWKKQTLASGLQKALMEQVVYAPLATSIFFFTMAYADSMRVDKAKQELRNKFWDAYKVALCYWPVVQTVNFTFVPERNRVVYVSFCSLLWIIFLTYVDEHGSPLKPRIKKLSSDEPSE